MFNRKLENFIWVYLGSASAFLYSLVFSRFLSIELYADFIITIAFSAFSQLLVNFGSDKVLLKSLNKYQYNRLELLEYDLLLRLFIFLIVTSLVFFLTEHVIVLVFVWYTINALFPKSLADEQGEIVQQNKSFGLEKIFSLVLIFSYYTVFEGQGSFLFFWCLIALRLLSVIHQYHFLCKGLIHSKNTKEIKFSHFKEHYIQSSFVMIALLSNAILLYGAQIVLKEYGEVEVVAVVGLGLQLCLVVQIFQSQLIRFFNKDIFSRGASCKNDLLKKMHKVLLPSVLLVFFMVIVSLFLESFYLSNNFQGIFLFSIYISPWLIFLGPASVVSQFFLSFYDTKYYLLISLFSGFLSIMLSMTLIPKYFEVGYLVQLYVAHFTSMVFQFLFVWRRLVNVSFN